MSLNWLGCYAQKLRSATSPDQFPNGPITPVPGGRRYVLRALDAIIQGFDPFSFLPIFRITSSHFTTHSGQLPARSRTPRCSECSDAAGSPLKHEIPPNLEKVE